MTATIRRLSLVAACLGAASSVQALTDLGPGKLFLDVSGELTYDSNIFTNASEQEDFIAQLTPSLSYVQDRGLLQMTATGQVRLQEYFDNSDQSGEDFLFSLELSGMHREPQPAVMFALVSSFFDISVANEELGDRVDISQFKFGLTVDASVSDKTGLRFGLDYGELDYDLSQYRDSSDRGLRADFLYRYSEKLSLRAGYRSRSVSYPGVTYDTDTFILGAEGELSAKLKGSVEVGALDGDALDGTQFYYAVGLNWDADANTGYALTGKRDVSASAIGAQSVTTSLRASVTQRFTDTVSGVGYVGVGKFERFDIVSRDDDVFLAGGGLNMAVGDNASVFANLDFGQRNSNSADSDYNRVLVSVGGNVRF